MRSVKHCLSVVLYLECCNRVEEINVPWLLGLSVYLYGQRCNCVRKEMCSQLGVYLCVCMIDGATVWQDECALTYAVYLCICMGMVHLGFCVVYGLNAISAYSVIQCF